MMSGYIVLYEYFFDMLCLIILDYFNLMMNCVKLFMWMSGVYVDILSFLFVMCGFWILWDS